MGDEPIVVPEHMYATGEQFPYGECRDCATLTLTDVPTDMSRYYPTGYYSLDLDPERVLGRAGVRQFARAVARSALVGRGWVASLAGAIPQRQLRTLISVLRAIRRSGLPRGTATRVLDVGCGSGMVVYALGLAGFRDVIGADPFLPADRTFASTGGRLLRRELADIHADGGFDLVMFHHSLEHVPDPAATLRDALALLAPGGSLLLRLPTVSSDAFERYRTSWVQLDAPRHMVLFSRAGVAALCERLDLEIVAVHDDSTGFQYWGSEQAQIGIPLSGPRSYAVSPHASPWSRRQIWRWNREAAAANRRGRGDQAAWIVAPRRRAAPAQS